MNLAVSEITKQSKAKFAPLESSAARPVLVLTINNGAGHMRAAEAIAEAWEKRGDQFSAQVVEVSDFMSPLARFTHITAYLWIVKNFPALWDKIDRYQKRQTQTSPEWFYRRECRRLFDLARRIQPVAIIATEVGCCEIAALIKRDLNLNVPLVAVNVNYEADRAWMQPEVDFYCLANETIVKDFIELGAKPENVAALGVPMQPEFAVPDEFERRAERRAISELFDLKADEPMILVAGGGEGLGQIEETVLRLLELKAVALQIIVLTGRNTKLRAKCERIAALPENKARLRVVGWTNRVPQLFRAADLLVSKLGNTFDEAMACALPIVALPPPPGAERAQYDLLEKMHVGRAVGTLDEMAQTVAALLSAPEELTQMRENATNFGRTEAATRIANWIEGKIFN